MIRVHEDTNTVGIGLRVFCVSAGRRCLHVETLRRFDAIVNVISGVRVGRLSIEWAHRAPDGSVSS